MAKKNPNKLKNLSGNLPFMSYDPALEAQLRSQARGLSDTLVDTHRAKKRAAADVATRRADVRQSEHRGMQSFSTQLHRGLLEAQQKRQDTHRTLSRGEQDFSYQLGQLIYGRNVKGQQQMEAANAAGVIGGSGDSTARAMSAARTGAFERARHPLDVGLGRLKADTGRTLGRIGVGVQQLRTDVGRGRTQLRQDTTHDLHLARRDYLRSIQDTQTQRQRAIREQKAGKLDITQEMIFNARQLNPGAFGKYGRRTNKPLRF